MRNTQPITTDEILRWWDDHQEAYADRLNPRLDDSMGTCVYTHPDTGEHCIAGQFLEDTGRIAPGPSSIHNTMALSALLGRSGPHMIPGERGYVAADERAWDLLVRLQQWADARSSWGEAFRSVYRFALNKEAGIS